jgi:hypothetical protein
MHLLWCHEGKQSLRCSLRSMSAAGAETKHGPLTPLPVNLQDAEFVCFNDRSPGSKVHILAIPKTHVGELSTPRVVPSTARADCDLLCHWPMRGLAVKDNVKVLTRDDVAMSQSLKRDASSPPAGADPVPVHS